jgi:hypothetical protein
MLHTVAIIHQDLAAAQYWSEIAKPRKREPHKETNFRLFELRKRKPLTGHSLPFVFESIGMVRQD